MNGTRTAAAISLAVPAALIAGAYAFQWHGLVACEMCWWQRYPHFAAIPLGALALLASGSHPRAARALALAAALCILASGVIGAYHAGVERHWWEGHTACTSAMPFTPGMTAEQRLEAMMRMPVVRCDVPQWQLLGVSLAGYNAIVSILSAALVAFLAARRR